MTQDLGAKLLDMKEKIAFAEKKAATLQGRLDGIYERMKSEFGVLTLDEADKVLIALDKELAEKEKRLSEKVSVLENEFQKLEV
jgi:predicted transcriptional regulator